MGEGGPQAAYPFYAWQELEVQAGRGIMEVHLPQNQKAQLTVLAIKTGRGTDDLMQEAVARLLA